MTTVHGEDPQGGADSWAEGEGGPVAKGDPVGEALTWKDVPWGTSPARGVSEGYRSSLLLDPGNKN